ncbi:hypothetical protein [Streptomyces sp. NPDC050546]|uniref:hypothetical protein n=1 Tax=Streptomyces sp. NPDC050546 TaxID=3365628 RepID=UPI0037941761
MTSSAALSGVAVRVLRTAAGRRALQVALLVGGVLVIGLLCGERAYAADGLRVSADSAAGRSVSGQGQLVRPDVHASADRVVRVVDDARKSVSGELVKAKRPVPPKSPSLPDLPDLSVPPKAPSAPVLPGLPPLSDLPAPPDAPAIPDLPGLPAPPEGDVTVSGAPVQPGLPGYPAPVTVDPQPADTPAAPATPAPAGEAAPVAHGPHGDQYGAPYADRAAQDHAAHDHTAHGRAHHLRRGAHAGASASVGGADPVGHVPGGRPDGTLCNRSLGDHGTPRHGDAHAVTPSGRAPMSLVRGVADRARVAGVRDGHRDIPVFPG